MIAQSKGKIAEIGLQIIQIDQDLRTEVGKDLIETRSKLSELAERKTAAVDQLNRIDIRAPQSGRVHELSVHTVGGVIAPGEQIMLIVPDADALAVEAKIAPRDIDQVYAGQAATMRFAAFNQKTTPEVDGEVSLVSADITQEQRTGTSYYTGRVLLKPDELAKLGSAKVLRGMPVEIFIKTPGRTALSYLSQAAAGSSGARIEGAVRHQSGHWKLHRLVSHPSRRFGCDLLALLAGFSTRQLRLIADIEVQSPRCSP
jgi:membrane fusion protein, type I secretion system